MGTLTEVFPGFEYNGVYIVNECPFCNERYSFRFVGNGQVYECVACKKHGTFEDLKKELSDDLLIDIENLEKPKPPKGLIVLSQYVEPKSTMQASCGFNPIDRQIGGLKDGELTIISGESGHGKSTFMSQVQLGLINQGICVCSYSGELSAGVVKRWMTRQASLESGLEEYQDIFGAQRWRVQEWVKSRILQWWGQNFILYDNKEIDEKERDPLLERFELAHRHYGAKVFVVDNLMTAAIPINQERDYLRAETNFVKSLKAFAIAKQAHVILAAHPRKNNTGKNQDVAGSGNIVNLADNVVFVKKIDEIDRGWDAEVEITKGREHGDLGIVKFNFCPKTKRFILTSGEQIERYGWEDLC